MIEYLMQIVARLENDGGQKNQEKYGRGKGFFFAPVGYVVRRHELQNQARKRTC